MADTQPGLPDEVVLQMAREEGAVLVTEDKDFGELIYRRGLAHSGVILLRVLGVPSSRRCEIVAAAIRQHGTEMSDQFSVISRQGLRIRSLRF